MLKVGIALLMCVLLAVGTVGAQVVKSPTPFKSPEPCGAGIPLPCTINYPWPDVDNLPGMDRPLTFISPVPWCQDTGGEQPCLPYRGAAKQEELREKKTVEVWWDDGGGVDR